jgi:hypothetical protein
MRRVPSQKIRTIAMVARNWIRWIRWTGMMPNALKRISGKNSSIDGPWNSGGASAARGAIRVAA